MDIKEFTKIMTREEFIKNKVGGYGEGGKCPESFKLKEIKNIKCYPETFRNCRKCWKKAVKNIKFKGEDEMKKFNWEIESEPKESTPEPQELFTFQEVIANIKEGEKYVSESRVFSLKEIISHRGMISFNGTFNSEKELHVNNKALFYKEEVKSVHIIHKVKHTPEGTLIDYRNPKGEESINDNVICHTEKGEIYGRRVTSELIKMTEKEYLEYPTIENINE